MFHALSCRIRPLFLTVSLLLLFSVGSSIIFLSSVRLPETLHEDLDVEFSEDSFALGWRLFNSTRSTVLRDQRQYNESRTLSQLFFTPECADAWIARGELCNAVVGGPEMGKEGLMKLSIVHTWVNGSDARLQRAREGAFEETKTEQIPVAGRIGVPNSALRMPGNAARHFMAHDELVHSLRSIMHSLPAGDIAGLHLVSTDLPTNDGTRAGQVPLWFKAEETCAPHVQVHHHWDLFKMRTGVNAREEEATQWREKALPSFNSIGIESQLVSLAPQLTNTILYFNDDFFLTRDLTTTDFSSPLFGTVFRMQSSIRASSTPKATARLDLEGEWPSLSYANWLLDQRFGERRRPYVQHFVKTYEKGILEEVAGIWGEELTESAEVRFRGGGYGTALGLAFLTSHFVVERHREALLWSFLVARSDRDNSHTYSPSERRTLLAELGFAYSSSQHSTLLIPRPVRVPLHAASDALARAGLPVPAATTYGFTSHEGAYAYAWLDGHVRREDGGEVVWVKTSDKKAPEKNWPNYRPKEGEGEGLECALDILDCFGDEFVVVKDGLDVGVEEVFKRVAFEKPRCGDCIIANLLAQSGTRGFEAFLPNVSSSEGEESLSMAKTWKDAQYDTAGGRRRAVSLLQRYSYAIGDSPAELITFTNSRTLRRRLTSLVTTITRNGNDGPAFLVLNDDTPDRTPAYEVTVIDGIMKVMLGKLWPDKMCWED